MSALAKLREFPKDAIEAAVAPLVSSLEAKKREEDEMQAAVNRAALKKHLENIKAIRQADAAVAKAKADEARAESDLARARAARVDAENQSWAVRAPWDRERDRLARGAYAQHVKDRARARVEDAIDALRSQGLAGVERPLRSLLRLRTTVVAICDGGEHPPADDLEAWVSEKIVQIQIDVEKAVAEYAAAQAASARAEVLQKIMSA